MYIDLPAKLDKHVIVVAKANLKNTLVCCLPTNAPFYP